LLGIGAFVLGWIIYSTRRGARKPVLAAVAGKHPRRSPSHAADARRRR
jgi:hypothetical protein